MSLSATPALFKLINVHVLWCTFLQMALTCAETLGLSEKLNPNSFMLFKDFIAVFPAIMYKRYLLLAAPTYAEKRGFIRIDLHIDCFCPCFNSLEGVL